MELKEVVRKLDTVTPAVAEQDNVPILAMYWFTGTHLMAYNSEIAISVPLETDFAGAVPKYINDLLSASAAETVTLTFEDSALNLKYGRSKSKLPTMGPEIIRDQFQIPETKLRPIKAEAKTEFLKALECCELALTDDTSRPEYLGMTVMPDGDDLLLFSTTGTTLAHARIPNEGMPTIKRPIILSRLFCLQMIRLGKTAESIRFGVFDDHALFDADDVRLFGRLIESTRQTNFKEIFTKNCPTQNIKKLIAIPPVLKNIIERACIITASKVAPAYTQLKVRDSELTAYSNTDRGEMLDRLPKIKHTDAELELNPALAKNVVQDFEKFLIADTCMIFSRHEDTQFYLVAGRDDNR